MKTIIVFDERSWKWFVDTDCTRAALESEFCYLESIYDYRGYLYLNKVYETLGLDWNPDNENLCFRMENGPIEFDYELMEDNTYKITITQ